MTRTLVLVLLGVAVAAVAAFVANAETIVPKTGPATLADLAPYTRKIETIRGLAFKQPVTSGTQTNAEFRAFVDKDLDAELPRARAECLSRAFARLGLLPEKFDLRKGYTDMMSAQAAAYYDPARKTFFVVHPDLPEMLLAPTIVHELTHALQDQNFGLESRLKALRAVDNEDVENAFRFLVEGEATYVMLLSTMSDQGVDPEQGGQALDGMIDGMSGTGRDALAEQLDAMKDILGEDNAADMASVLSSPDYLFRVLYDPYFAGQAAVHKIRRAGGWAAVNELWRNPPTSTEMLLHPEKLARGRRDEPVKVAVPDASAALGAGYVSACENTLGELETEILLEVALPASGERAGRARTAAAGWGGDRWRSFEKAGGGTVVVWQTVWDTPADAAEFDQAISQAGVARLPQGALLPTTGDGCKLRGTADPAAPTTLVVHIGKEVTLVAGASTPQARAIIAKMYPWCGTPDPPARPDAPAPAPAKP
jgi:hypothetical protein